MIRWYRRIATIMAAAVVGALVPAVAWAQTDPVAVAVGDELARRRTRGGGIVGIVGTLCCLAVVALIVLVILLVARRRSR
jgi:hypothetical protein